MKTIARLPILLQLIAAVGLVLLFVACSAGSESSYESREEAVLAQGKAPTESEWMETEQSAEVTSEELAGKDKLESRNVVPEKSAEPAVEVTGDNTRNTSSVDEGQEETNDVRKEPEMDQSAVTIAIGGLDGAKMILDETVVNTEMGDTVLELLLRITQSKRIQMEHRGRGRMGYVVAIDNLYEFDHGPGSGWMYSVNGVYPDNSSGGWEISPGDTIRWVYTLDAGRDLGARDQ